METGHIINTELGEKLDHDNMLPINQHVDYARDWLTKDMAVDVIKHLSKVFGLPEILEAVEKYEEAK